MALSSSKSKQRINKDPHNKNWIGNKKGVGYKLLCKMGWDETKTLDKINYIKISHKGSDVTEGLGYSNNKNVSQTLKSDESYLATGSINNSKSLSKSIKKISHRKKNIMSKQISNYSLSDLKGIL